MWPKNSTDRRNDPDVAESDRLRKRIAELEQVVRELRQRNPSRTSAPSSSLPVEAESAESDRGGDSKKRRVIVDRFARFKMDEAAMAEVAAAAAAGDDAGSQPKDYRAEPYQTHQLPGEEIVYDRIGRKTFLGAPAGKSMLRRVSHCGDNADDSSAS